MVAGTFRLILASALVLLFAGCQINDMVDEGWPCDPYRLCEKGWACQDNICVQQEPVSYGGSDCPSEKNCSGLECGPDPVCGESCGLCSGGQTCQSGQCIGLSSVGTWTDSISNLTWQVTPTGGSMNWSNAKAHCTSLSLDGGGWHLPTIGELRTLIRGCSATETSGTCNVKEGQCVEWSCIDHSCSGCTPKDGPGAGGMYWPDEIQGDCCWYWSSSPVEDGGNGAWFVSFNGGDVGGNGDGGVFYDGHVRCVR